MFRRLPINQATGIQEKEVGTDISRYVKVVFMLFSTFIAKIVC